MGDYFVKQETEGEYKGTWGAYEKMGKEDLCLEARLATKEAAEKAVKECERMDVAKDKAEDLWDEFKDEFKDIKRGELESIWKSMP